MENFLTAIENHTWLSLLLFFAIIAIISEINEQGFVPFYSEVEL